MAPPSKKRKESDAAHRKPADKEGGVKYWTSRPATVDGVLGGFGTLSHADAMSSRMFLLTVAPHLSRIKGPGNSDGKAAATTKQKTRALDVGSGIGRVTSTVLLPLVDYVDIVEPTPHFVQEALRAAKAGEWKSLYDTRNMQEVKTVRFYELGLQDFRPDDVKSNESGCIGSIGVAVNEQEPAGYDIIWCQWCLGHLSDDELVDWFKACKRGLRDSKSVIVVKENAVGGREREFDEEDRSWTRSTKLWKQLFQKADLTIIREDLQHGFPDDLFPVWMYALR